MAQKRKKTKIHHLVDVIKIFFMIDGVPGTVLQAISMDLPSMMVLKEEGLEQHEQINNLHSKVRVPTLFKWVLLLLTMGGYTNSYWGKRIFKKRPELFFSFSYNVQNSFHFIKRY